MKASSLILVLIIMLGLSSDLVAQNPTAAKAELTEIWRTDAVLSTCESVLYSEDQNLLFVSCINGNPTEKNGKGYIALLEPDGTLKELNWVTGLNAPKGMGIWDGKLYVTDIDELVVIHIKKAEIVDRIPVKGSSFLNDIAIDADGTVYFSDSDTCILWIYQDG